MDVIINDSVAIFPFSGPQPLDADYCGRLGQLLLQLLAMAVRDGRLDARAGFVSDLQRLTAERSLSVERLFAFVYLTERTALDELALNDSLGATSEPWPLVAQMIRRASFDVLAAHTERNQQEPSGSLLVDRLTTLYSRAVMDVVLASRGAALRSIQLPDGAHRVRRRSPVGHQQRVRVRRRRSSARTAGNTDPQLLPPERLGLPSRGGLHCRPALPGDPGRRDVRLRRRC